MKEHVSVPVIANGNIFRHADADRCLAATRCDAVMSAEWLRRNPVTIIILLLLSLYSMILSLF